MVAAAVLYHVVESSVTVPWMNGTMLTRFERGIALREKNIEVPCSTQEICEDLADALNEARTRRKCEKERNAFISYWSSTGSHFTNGMIPPFSCMDTE